MIWQLAPLAQNTFLPSCWWWLWWWRFWWFRWWWHWWWLWYHEKWWWPWQMLVAAMVILMWIILFSGQNHHEIYGNLESRFWVQHHYKYMWNQWKHVKTWKSCEDMGKYVKSCKSCENMAKYVKTWKSCENWTRMLFQSNQRIIQGEPSLTLTEPAPNAFMMC